MSQTSRQPSAPGLKSRLAERLREALRVEILRGRWTDCLPGERDIGLEFHVSRPSVRLALGALAHEGLLQIRRGHPCRILQSAGAAPATPGRRPVVVVLRDARMKPDTTSVMMVVDLLWAKLHAEGLGLQVVDALAYGTSGLSKALAEIDARHRPSFYVLWSLPPTAQQWFMQRQLPAVIVGSPATQINLPAMDVDHEATIRHAVHYLLRRGHRRLALLNIPATTVGSVRVDELFLRTCAEAKLPADPRLVFHTILRPDAVASTVRRMITSATPPTAVIATDLELLIGLYTMLGELGRVIPRDVSVVSTNYWPIVDFLRPVPTCYGLSWSSIANRIARLIHNHQQLGVWPHRFWKLMPAFHEGASVATR